MKGLRISTVTYLNSKPFIGPLEKHSTQYGYQLTLDVPSECARKLASDEADIGLVPVGSLPDLPFYEIVSNYCIGADGNVRTVVLASDCPLNEIEVIYPDSHSRSSNLLAKVLARYHWKINPKWETPSSKKLEEKEARVLIGDKVFENEGKFTYFTDMASEWKAMTGLPFVFAVWASTKKLTIEDQSLLNQILKEGVENLDKVLEEAQQQHPNTDLSQYFTQNIQYNLDDKKKSALNLYLQLAKDTTSEMGNGH